MSEPKATEITPEAQAKLDEKAAKAVAKKEAAEAKKKEAAEKKATAATAKKEELASKKAARETELSAKKQAKLDAKQAKDDERAEKKAAVEAEKKVKADEKKANQMPEKNEVRRPRPESLCGQAWAFADKLSSELKQPVPIKQLLEATDAAGLNPGNVKAEYARWRKFNGVTGRVSLPKPAVEEKAAEAPAKA